MDQAIAINIPEDVLEACCQFLQLAGIAISLRAQPENASFKTIKNLKFVFFGLKENEPIAQQLLQATNFRALNSEHAVVHLICLGTLSYDAVKSAVDDYEFVNYLSIPLQPVKFLETTRSVLDFSAKNSALLESRRSLVSFLSTRNFKSAAKNLDIIKPLYEKNPLQHRLLKIQYFNKLCDTKSLYLELKSTLTDFPGSLKTREMWTALLDQLGRTNELKTALAEALNQYPNHAYFLVLEGDLCFGLGQFAKAETYYSKAFEMQADLNEAKWGLLLSHFVQPKKFFGKDLLGSVDTTSKKFLKYSDRRFRALASANRWQDAAALMHGILRERRVNSSEHLRWMNYAVALLRSGSEDKSIDALKKCIAIAPPGYKNGKELLEKIMAGSFSSELLKVVDL